MASIEITSRQNSCSKIMKYILKKNPNSNAKCNLEAVIYCKSAEECKYSIISNYNNQAELLLQQ